MTRLFDDPPIAGLRYEEALITEEEEQALLERLMAIELAPFRFRGWLGNRKTQSFGWRYDFDDASFTPTDPVPDWLGPLRARAAAFTGLFPDDLGHVLLARYDPGAGIGWHRDRDVFEHVVGISLNTPATLRLRQRTTTGFRRASVEVQPRSAYLLSGESRWEWEHSIAPGDRCSPTAWFFATNLSRALRRSSRGAIEQGLAAHFEQVKRHELSRRRH